MSSPTAGTAPVDAVVYDLGTNTFRWLAATIEGGRWREVARGREILGFGRALTATGVIADEDLAGACALLRDWRPGAGIVPPAAVVRGFATHAVRVAANRADVVKALEAALAAPIEVLSAAREGELAFAGAAGGMRPGIGRWALLDIGGGSTELSWGEGLAYVGSRSLPLGVVTLASPADETLAMAVERTRTALDQAVREVYNEGMPALLAEARPSALASSCGTASAVALAFLGLTEYDRARLDGVRVSQNGLQALIADRAEARPVDWIDVPGVGPKRAHLIGPGLGLLAAFVEAAGLPEWTNVESGLLEGAMALVAATAAGRP